MFGSKLAAAYYLVPALSLLGNVVFVVRPELELPPEERSRARLSVPLSPSSMCARWEAVEGAAAAPAGGRLKVTVGVTNCGDRVWPDDVWGGPADHWGAHAVRFGARWARAEGPARGTELPWRASLPHAVLPGRRMDLTLYVPTPPEPGKYVVELDLVQDLVAWFGDAGAETLRLGVDLR